LATIGSLLSFAFDWEIIVVIAVCSLGKKQTIEESVSWQAASDLSISSILQIFIEAELTQMLVQLQAFQIL
jgi:hypothetical protein